MLFRISALDLVEGGLTGDEIAVEARALEGAGVDAISTGIGWHEARVPTIAYMVPRAAWRFALRCVKDAVGVPVIATNRINQPEVAEDIIACGDADLVALARPLLADPEFALKAATGRRNEINTCIACNQACLDFIFSQRMATCLVNPRAGLETELSGRPADRPKRIAVVGAGAAGLAFAVAAAERGHRITLYEAASEIGGQLLLAARVPGKSEYAELIRYFRARLERLEVDLRLGSSPSAESLAADGYDDIVVATGVRPVHPSIDGIDRAHVVAYPEVLSGSIEPGRRVAIIGAGGIAFDVALALVQPPHAADDPAAFFGRWGVDASMAVPGALTEPRPTPPLREVTLLQRSTKRPGERLGISTGWILRTELRQAGVDMIPGCTYRRIDADGIHVTVAGQDRCIPADTVVVCAGQASRTDLPETLRAANVPFHIIGGASNAEGIDARRAIAEGHRLAQEL